MTRTAIADTKQLPPQLEAILQRVQNSANYMPEWQTEVSTPTARAHPGDVGTKKKTNENLSTGDKNVFH